MALLLKALLNDPLPGWDRAFSPLARTDLEFPAGVGNSIGAAWLLQDSTGTGEGLVWHDGCANGFSSAVVLDRTLGRAVFLSLVDATLEMDASELALLLLPYRPGNASIA